MGWVGATAHNPAHGGQSMFGCGLRLDPPCCANAQFDGSTVKGLNHDDNAGAPRPLDRGLHHGCFQRHILAGNGLFMLAAPAAWYEFVPGDTGAFNQHFIRDIGIIQLFLGLAFGIGFLRPEGRIWLWTVATLWLSAHAIFHLWEVAVGICSPSVIVRDFPAVSLPAVVGAMLTLWAIHDAHARRAVCA